MFHWSHDCLSALTAFIQFHTFLRRQISEESVSTLANVGKALKAALLKQASRVTHHYSLVTGSTCWHVGSHTVPHSLSSSFLPHFGFSIAEKVWFIQKRHIGDSRIGTHLGVIGQLFSLSHSEFKLGNSHLQHESWWEIDKLKVTSGYLGMTDPHKMLHSESKAGLLRFLNSKFTIKCFAEDSLRTPQKPRTHREKQRKVENVWNERFRSEELYFNSPFPIELPWLNEQLVKCNDERLGGVMRGKRVKSAHESKD